jgi:golgi phosphoprotein 3
MEHYFMLTLSLPEELFLMALHEDKGKVHNSVAMSVHYGLGGALLAELALRKMIEIAPKGRVIVLDSAPCGDEILDEAYAKIRDADKAYKVRHWVEEFSDNIRKLQKRLAENLVTKGVLRQEEQKYLWVIPYDVYPQLDASAKYWLKNRLREVLLAAHPAEAHDIVLLSLMRACGLLPFIITRDEQKAARLRIEQLTNNEEVGKAVQDAIEMVEMAAVTASMMATVG